MTLFFCVLKNIEKISKKSQKTIDKPKNVCYNGITVKRKGDNEMVTVRMWSNIYEVTVDGVLYQFDTEKDMHTSLEMLLKSRKKGGAK